MSVRTLYARLAKVEVTFFHAAVITGVRRVEHLPTAVAS